MKKITKILIIIWTVSLAVNIRYILGPIKDFGANQQLEHLTFQIPLSAVLALLVAIFLILDNSKKSAKKWRRQTSFIAVMSILATIVLVLSTILSSHNQAISFYWVGLIVIYILPTIIMLKQGRRKLVKIVLKAAVIAGVVISLVGITQFALGHTLGLHILGEIIADSDTYGAAKVISEGHKLLRPVGLFPHANIYGGYLVISLLITILVIKKAANGSLWRRWATLIVGILSLGILFSFSRGSWLALIILVLLGSFYSATFRKAARLSLVTLFLAFLLFFSAIIARFNFDGQVEQFSVRNSLRDYSITLARNNLLLGVGPKNSVWLLNQGANLPPYAIQPVHNTFILIVAEYGLILSIWGLSWFILWSARQTMLSNYFPLLAIFSVFPLLWLDHYLFSLTVGLGILSLLLLALTFSGPRSHQPK